MKSNYRLTTAITLGILALTSCGQQVLPNVPTAQSNQSLKTLITGQSPSSTLTKQTVYVEPDRVIGSFMQSNMVNDPLIVSSISTLGISTSASSALNWSKGVQEVTDRSTVMDDAYYVQVTVPLVSDPKIKYSYSALYQSGGNETGYRTTNVQIGVLRVDKDNSITRASLWSLTDRDISTWVITTNSANLQGLSNYNTLNDGSYLIAEDIGVPASVRSVASTMKPGTVGGLTVQGIVVNPITPPPSCGDVANSNGGIQPQGIVVCPIKPPTPPASDPVFVSKPNCKALEFDVQTAKNNYAGYSAAATASFYGIFAVPFPADVFAGAFSLGALFLARGAGMNLAATRQRLYDCLNPKTTAFGKFNPVAYKTPCTA